MERGKPQNPYALAPSIPCGRPSFSVLVIFLSQFELDLCQPLFSLLINRNGLALQHGFRFLGRQFCQSGSVVRSARVSARGDGRACRHWRFASSNSKGFT